MKNRDTFVICDSDEAYAKALGKYLMSRKELSFQILACSSPEHLHMLFEKGRVDYLLMEEALYPQEKPCFRRVRKGCILGESRNRRIKTKETVIYKYQSGEAILQEFLLSCAELMERSALYHLKEGKEKKIIGVFSPVHRVGKTGYCLELGKRLSEESNVLLLNMELYGGIDGHFDAGTQNLSDVLYYGRQEKGNLGLLLSTLVRHEQTLDYVLPVAVSEDLKSVKAGEWVQVLRRILEESIYEVLVLDLDEGLPQVYEILEFCSEIHMLTLENPYSLSKVRQFERELSLLGKEELLKKIRRIPRKGGRI